MLTAPPAAPAVPARILQPPSQFVTQGNPDVQTPAQLLLGDDDPPAAVALKLRTGPAGSTQLDACLLAFGNALEAAHDRRGRVVVETLLVAQHEQLAMLMQALADQRHDYRGELERMVQGYGEHLERAVKKLSDELTPESITQIGDIFHTSAGQITGALSRAERLHGRSIDKQNQILEVLGTLTERVSSLLAVVTDLKDLGGELATLAPQRTSAPREPERRLAVVPASPDVLAVIREDLDSDDDP